MARVGSDGRTPRRGHTLGRTYVGGSSAARKRSKSRRSRATAAARRLLLRAPESGRVEGGVGCGATFAVATMERWAWMSCEIWEEKVLRAPGARERVDEIEGELRVAAGVTRRGKGEDHA